MLQKNTMVVYPFVTVLLHLFSLAAIVVFMVNAIRARRTMRRDMLAVFGAWFMFYFGYMAFSIAVAPVYMRLIDPIYILCIAMPAALLSYRPLRTE